jgi:hypothetical protein
MKINWWRVLGFGIILLPWFLIAALAHGQTINGVVTECGKKCSGEFTIVNNDVKPLAVSIEAKQFSIAAGQQAMHPLDASTQLTLSETSARIAPKGQHDFDFKLRCAQMPCQVEILVGMALGHTTEGLQVRGILPHVVYLCERAKDCRKQTLAAGGVPQQ